MKAITGRMTPVRIAMALLVLLAGLAVVVGSGYLSSDVEVDFGSTWLVNEADGEIARVSGPSAEVDFRLVDLADPSDELELQTSGNDVYLLNSTAGLLQRIDGRTLRVAIQVDAPSGDTAELVVPPSTDANVLLLDGEDGEARLVDRDDLSTAQTYETSTGNLSGSVDKDGTVWLTDPDDGEVISFLAGTAQEDQRVDVGDEGDAVEISIDDGGGANAFNLTDGTWFRLSGSGATSLSEWPDADARPMAGQWSQPSFSLGADWVSFDEDGSVRSTTKVGDGDELGRPFIDRGRAFVADPSTGAVAILDAQSGEVLHELSLIDGGGWLTTTAVDGYGFAVEAGAARAWVIDPDGNPTQVNLASEEAIRVTPDGEDQSEEPTDDGDEEEEVDETTSSGGVVVEATTTTTSPPPTTDPPCTEDCEGEPPTTEPCTVGGGAPVCTPCQGGGSVNPATDTCPAECGAGGYPPAGSSCNACGDGSTSLAPCTTCEVGPSTNHGCATCEVGGTTSGVCSTCDWGGTTAYSCTQCSVGGTTAFACNSCTVGGSSTQACTTCGDGRSTTGDCTPCDFPPPDSVADGSCPAGPPPTDPPPVTTVPPAATEAPSSPSSQGPTTAGAAVLLALVGVWFHLRRRADQH
jgi:hypothetical protein